MAEFVSVSSVGSSAAGRRRRLQRGAAFTELALTLLPSLMLILAAIDLSIPIFLHSLFNNAARAGTRYGITYQTRTGLSHAESIKKVVQENAIGFLDGDREDLIQVKFYSPATFQEVSGADANDGGNIVEVNITGYRWDAIAPLWGTPTGLTVKATSADRLETLPRGTQRPAP